MRSCRGPAGRGSQTQTQTQTMTPPQPMDRGSAVRARESWEMGETADQDTTTEPARSVQLLTVPEVAGRLRVSEAKVWQLLSSGRLRSVKIDTSRRIPEDAVAEYIASLV